MTRRRTGVAAVVSVAIAVGAFFAARPDEPAGELVLWPFENARISTINNSVQVRPYAPSDSDCYEYSHIDTEITGDELLVSLYFERIGPQFCEVPCPLATLAPVSAEIHPRPTTKLTPVRHPDTPPHCSEGLE